MEAALPLHAELADGADLLNHLGDELRCVPEVSFLPAARARDLWPQVDAYLEARPAENMAAGQLHWLGHALVAYYAQQLLRSVRRGGHRAWALVFLYLG